MEQWIENKDYIESLIGPLEKQCAVQQYYINSLLKTQKKISILFDQHTIDIKEIQKQQEKITNRFD